MSRPVGARNGHALNKGQSGKPLAGASKKLKAMPFIRGKAVRPWLDSKKLMAMPFIRGKAPTYVSPWCNHGFKDCMIYEALKGRPNLRTYIDHAKQHHITWQGCNFSAE